MESLVIIFLDIDGVLVTPASSFRRSRTGMVADPDAVSALKYLVDQTGASLVITSTWRLEYSQAELLALMEEWGVQTGILGITPSGASRRDEIMAWLGDYRGRAPIGSFVILDDSPDMGDLCPRLVQTDFETGLTMSDALAAIDLLDRGSQALS